jgi:hypothetical protein
MVFVAFQFCLGLVDFVIDLVHFLFHVDFLALDFLLLSMLLVQLLFQFFILLVQSNLVLLQEPLKSKN